jgi:hypothetical protein
MSKLDETIARMRDKGFERDHLLAVLSLWSVAKAAGYSSDEVKAFTFRAEFITDKVLAGKFRLASLGWRKEFGDTHHNCVRLVTGELKAIPLTERPPKYEI